MVLFFAPCLLVAQERGAIALGEAVLGLGVNTRVLMIGAHPDDEDTFLIAWLSRGRHVTTAYLSLTRGDGGQNLIGNELGEALGVIRTEELLAARRIDGADQYFTRAFDFGFSKDTVDTYKHWPKDSILGDVVRVVRAFRPHVIVAVFSGTPRDGHGHHQVSGLLAREAYDLAADTVRFSESAHGRMWMPLKFYRAARGSQQNATIGMDVGEYSPLLGRSYAEIAGESRSQHKSQGFGSLQRKGPLMNYLRREATRVNESTPAQSEQSLFDGIDTTWARLRGAMSGSRARAALDSLPAAITAARASYDPLTPAKLLPLLVGVQRLLRDMTEPAPRFDADLFATWLELTQRFNRAVMLAAGVEIESFAPREIHPLRRTARVVTTIYNRGTVPVRVSRPAEPSNVVLMDARSLPPGTAMSDTSEVVIDSISQPGWLRTPRVGAMFTQSVSTWSETSLTSGPAVHVGLSVPDAPYAIPITTPVVFRSVDAVRGDLRQHAVGGPAIALTLDQREQYAPANASFDRDVAVHLRSADTSSRVVRVNLLLPRGLTADSATRTVSLTRYDAQQTVTFRVRGRLPAGEHRLAAVAESNGETFVTGYDLIDYDHIRRQRVYRRADVRLSAVDVRVPAALRVAYVPGVSDNVAPALSQLGIPVTVIPARDLGQTPIAGFTTIVVGPRAYEAHPELVAANARLLDFARRGGTVVVQYGQYEMMQPGIMPYPITIPRPHDRVTHENAPVTIVDPSARELSFPNRITASDFDGWVQERSLYMPRTFDAQYRPLLALSDPGEPANRGAILVAPVGSGQYIYTTLAFFRQLPAGVPGPARLFVNLLSAGLSAQRTR